MFITQTTFKNHLSFILQNTKNIQVKSPEEKVKLLILRDLFRLNWKMDIDNERILIAPPKYYNKTIIKNAMSVKRNEILQNNRSWIEKHIDLARENLANGKEVLSADIDPIIEVCENKGQHNLFRLFRYYWSSPYSDYVGRRIKFIIRDSSLPNNPVIGIAAIGSPIIHIPERDDWIGWNKETRTDKLIYTMDAYVIGALPPYNLLLGGKLISYILASNEIRTIYQEKYYNQVTKIKNRTVNDLVCIFTTSLYGKSSQYNRIKFHDNLLYIPIGETKGYGSLHLTQETFVAMQELLKSKNIHISNNFGSGPSWRMRVIRAAGDILGFDSDFLLRHSFKRAIYAVPLASNYKKFLNGEDKTPQYYNYPMKDLVTFWKKRWLSMRLNNSEIINKVMQFDKNNFNI